MEQSPYCSPSLTFGCLDQQRIWLRGLCHGRFRRFNVRFAAHGAVAECLLATSSLHEYEECDLPEPPPDFPLMKLVTLPGKLDSMPGLRISIEVR